MKPDVEAVIAAAASFVFACLLFATVALLCCRRRYHNKSAELPTHHRRCHRSKQQQQQQLQCLPDESASFDPSLEISMPVLISATNNFSPDLVIGDGGFGLVYKAHLPPHNQPVAVKKLSPEAAAFQGFREFHAEIETLSNIRHPNLVRILGYSVSGIDRLLVYELLDNGSLDEWLHDDECPRRLPWPSRLRIIRGIAAGLTFLHDDCRPCIIHRDIKSSNVLLDSEFEARIADFGLARKVESSRSHVSTQVAGTMGYMPPEYREGVVTWATVKADVYSFGMVMLEVATGRRPNLGVRVEGRDVALARWVRKMVEEGRGVEVVEAEMEGVVEAEVVGFLAAALRCVGDWHKDRPLMREVVVLLNEL